MESNRKYKNLLLREQVEVTGNYAKVCTFMLSLKLKKTDFFFLLVFILAWVRGGKVQGGHTDGKQVFFDFLELKGLMGEIASKKKGGRKERERAVTLSH